MSEVAASADKVDQEAVRRLCEALRAAGVAAEVPVMQAFSRAWRYEQSLAEAALRQLNASVVTPERALDAVAREPRTYLGPPDRLHALCRSGYGAVFELAIVLGGPVFPVVWRRAALQEISVLELLFAPRFGPYASRTSADALYDLLDGTEVRIVRPATSEPMALGTVGEVQVRDRASEAWFSTGMLSALELVPHNHRAPRLTGWLGPADAALTLKTGQRIGAEQLASVVGYHEAVLDARLLVGARRAPETDPDLTLQVETEAGAWIEADLAQRMQKAVGLVDLRIERVLPGALAMTGRAVGYRAASTLGARA